MNTKMTINLQLLTTEQNKNKNKLNKQLNRNRITEMEITWRVISRELEGENEGKGTGNRKHNL